MAQLARAHCARLALAHSVGYALRDGSIDTRPTQPERSSPYEEQAMNMLQQAFYQLTLGAPVRENHALEHATIVLLSKRFPEVRFSGISFASGFFVFGDVPTAAVRPAADQ